MTEQAVAPTQDKIYCIATTRSGQPCKNYALDGSSYCRRHQSLQSDEPQLAEPAEEPEIPNEELRLQLAQELDKLIERVQTMTPGYTPPPFSASRLIRLIEENIEKLSPDFRIGLLDKLRGSIASDLFDLDTWKGVWYMLN